MASRPPLPPVAETPPAETLAAEAPSVPSPSPPPAAAPVDAAWGDLLRQLRSQGDLSLAGAFAESLVGQDIVVPLLRAVQRVERAAGSVVPRPPPANSQAAIDAADAALQLLLAFCEVAVARLAEAGWVPVDKPASCAGGIVYRHAASGRESEDPALPGATWEARLMQMLPILFTPGELDGDVCWAARVVDWTPADGGAPFGGAGGGEGTGAAAANAAGADAADADAAGGDAADGGGDASVSAVSGNVSVFDVLTVEQTAAKRNGGAARARRQRGKRDGASMVLLRQMTIGPWRGVNEFIETEVEPGKPVGESLDAWYTASLLGVALLSLHQQQRRRRRQERQGRRQGRQQRQPRGQLRVLVLGLGGGCIPSFLARYAPAVAVEAVEMSPAVAAAATSCFGLGAACTVHIADARDFVREATAAGRRFDAVLVDVYTSERFPPSLLGDDFFLNVHALLADDGVVVVNAGCSDDPSHADVLASFARAFAGSVAMTEPAELVASGEGARAYESAVLVARRGGRDVLSAFSAEQWAAAAAASADDDAAADTDASEEVAGVEGADGAAAAEEGEERSVVAVAQLPFRLASVASQEEQQPAAAAPSAAVPAPAPASAASAAAAAVAWCKVQWEENTSPPTAAAEALAGDDAAWGLFGDDTDSETDSDNVSDNGSSSDN